MPTLCDPASSIPACSSPSEASTTWCVAPVLSFSSRMAGRLYSRSCPKEPRSLTHSRPCCVAWVHGSVLPGWYLAPHRRKSVPKALSVSASAGCAASSSPRAAACGGGRAMALTGAGAAGGAARSGGAAARAVVACALQGGRFHSVTVMSTSRAGGGQCPREPVRAEAPAEHFRGGAAHQAGRDLVAVERIGPEQRPVADHVDDARHALRQPECLVQRVGREDVGGGTRHPQPVPHVGGGLLARQRIQVVAAGDALRQLAQLVA